MRNQHIPLFLILLLCPVCCPIDFILSEVTAEFIAIVVLVVYGALLLFQRTHFSFNGLDLLFLGFVLWYSWRILFTASPVNNWVIIQIVGCLMLYFYGRYIRSEISFFRLLFIAALLQAGWGIMQWFDCLPSYHTLFSTTGSFYNPALWGIFSTLGLLAGIASFERQQKIGIRILWAAGMFLLLFCIVLSASRASWIALTAGICWIGLTSGRGKSLWRRKSVLFTAGFLAIGVIACYGLYMLRPDSVRGRFLIWQIITERIFDAPFYGHGALRGWYMPMQAAWFAKHPGNTSGMLADDNVYAFNEFLRITFETGFIGLLLFVATLVLALRKAFNAGRAARYAGGILLAVVGFGCFSYPFSSPLIMAVTVIALAVVSRNGETCSSAGWCLKTPVRWGLACLCAAFLCFASMQYCIAKRADLFLQEAQYRPTVLDEERANRYARHLQGNPDFMLSYGKTLYNNKHYSEALPVLEQASRLKPSSRLWCDLGDCYRWSGKISQAEEAYILASQMTPARILPHYRLFCLYKEENMTEKAVKQAKYMLDMPVKVVNTSVLRYRNQARLFLKTKQSTE